MQDTNRVKVWDPLVRIFHWSLVAAFAVAYVTEDEALAVHVAAGYTVLGLVLFRLLWGLVGTRHARFTDFVHRPSAVIRYMKELLLLRPPRYLGHNPAGGLMIVALLASLLATVLTGLAAYGAEEAAGPLAGFMAGLGAYWGGAAEEVHELFADFTVLLAVFHVSGVVLDSLLHRENLVRSMFTGYKRATREEAGSGLRVSRSDGAGPTKQEVIQ